MKSYHLTQEQASEIASNLELDGRDITVWTNGRVEFETKEALQSFANAVLDQVLGEPVAFMLPYTDYWKNLSDEEFSLKIVYLAEDRTNGIDHSIALYAPKEQS